MHWACGGDIWMQRLSSGSEASWTSPKVCPLASVGLRVLGLGSVQCNGHARVMSHAELLYQQILFLGALRPALLHEPVSIYRVKACWGMLSPARVLRQQSLLFKP